MSEKYPLDNISSAGNYSIYMSSGAALCAPRLIQSVLSSNDKIIVPISASGTLTKPFNELLEFIKNTGARCLYNNKDSDLVFTWDDYSYVDIYFGKKENTISISGKTVNPEFKNLSKTLEEQFISTIKKNLVFTIVKNSSGLGISSLGDGSTPFIEENYLPKVVEDIKYVVSSFEKKPPPGRICILNGEPGTGKTHLIRSVLREIDNVFVIIPSNLIDSLDKPEFMPLLMDIKRDYDKPIIMIIEDGDVCLVPRRNDNISTISSLLNLSDGILGSIIDIKMIISTNADIKDMDPAIMRTGRLCKNINVAPLPYEQANRVYQRESKKTDDLLFRKTYTLAEIYSKANNLEEVVLETKQSSRRSIGFNFEPTTKDLTLNRSNKDLEIK